MDLYAQNIIDHYRNPRNYGTLARISVTHREANHVCGDIIETDIVVAHDTINQITFRGEGCAISQAAMSILSEFIVGKKLNEVLSLRFKDIKKLLGIPISDRRLQCSLLGLLAAQNALLKYQKKHILQWSDLIEENLV